VKDTEILVIGIGNRLRGDDGVGPFIAETVGARHAGRIQAIAVHQLTPELAIEFRDKKLVFFVDAQFSSNTSKATPSMTRVAPTEMPTAHWHSYSPQQLLMVARDLYGAHTSAWIVSIPVCAFQVGCELSESAMIKAAKAINWIEEVFQASAATVDK